MNFTFYYVVMDDWSLLTNTKQNAEKIASLISDERDNDYLDNGGSKYSGDWDRLSAPSICKVIMGSAGIDCEWVWGGEDFSGEDIHDLIYDILDSKIITRVGNTTRSLKQGKTLFEVLNMAFKK